MRPPETAIIVKSLARRKCMAEPLQAVPIASALARAFI
jgi:hypothetical protein